MVRLYGRAGRLTAENGGFRPGQWTEYARGARCQLCKDVGSTDTVEYDVKPGWCVIDDNVIPGSVVGLPGSKQEHSDLTPGSAGALPATAPHSAYLTAIAQMVDEFDCMPDGMWHHQQLQLPAPAAGLDEGLLSFSLSNFRLYGNPYTKTKDRNE